MRRLQKLKDEKKGRDLVENKSSQRPISRSLLSLRKISRQKEVSRDVILCSLVLFWNYNNLKKYYSSTEKIKPVYSNKFNSKAVGVRYQYR